jgi:hypothetical protein
MLHRSFSIGILLIPALAMAQSVGAPPPEASTPSALAAAPAPKTQDAPAKKPAVKPEERQITDLDIAHALVDSLPKFNPAKPDDAAPPVEEPSPKNHIIRLPDYVVNGQKPPPVFSEREIHTKEGLEALAMQRYMSQFDQILNGGSLFFNSGSPSDRAVQMFREDERLGNMADLNDTANSITRGGDAAEGLYIKQASQDTYRRTPDWGWGAKDNLGLGADQGY